MAHLVLARLGLALWFTERYRKGMRRRDLAIVSTFEPGSDSALNVIVRLLSGYVK